MEEIHERLRAQLKVLGLSQAEAARKAGLPDSQGLRDVLAGRKRLATDMLAALAGVGVDVAFVVTGASDELERRMAAIRTSTQVAMLASDPAARSAIQQASFDALVNALSAEEQRLIGLYRQADARGKAALLASASALAVQSMPAVKKSRKKS